jgi:predicted RNA-binding Zn-ribbon protein involved in translation (DUF1610 family)
MPSTFPCPKCGEYHYHKSHSKNYVERLRKIVLKERSYRCHQCGYRGMERKVNISKKFTKKHLLYYSGVFLTAILVGILCQFLIQ